MSAQFWGGGVNKTQLASFLAGKGADMIGVYDWATTRLGAFFRGKYLVKQIAGDQGAVGTTGTLAYLINHIGANKATINLAGAYTYNFLTDVTVPSNINMVIDKGAILNPGAGVTVTIYSPYHINAQPNQHIFTGAGTIAFTVAGDVYPDWWAVNTAPGTTNMSAAINAAIQSTDAFIKFLGETYLVTPDVHVSGISGSPVHSCFAVKDNMHLRGIPGKTILKIADGVSTDIAPLLHYFFASGASNQDISFEGITFDFNGVNNPISPGRPAVYNTYHQSAMYWGGTLGKVDNLIVNNCVFKTSPGTNIIVVSDNNFTGTLSDNIKIIFNYFIDNGWDTSDHTTVLLLAKNSEISDNVFTIPTLEIIVQNAIDVHGPYNTIRDNIVLDYISAIGITQNENLWDVHNVDVHDNIISVYGIGVWLARHSSGVKDYYNISVHDNIIEINDAAYMTGLGALGSYGIAIMPDLDICRIYIENNIISKLGGTTYASYGIVAFPTALSTIYDLFIEGNKVDFFTQGISVPGFATNGSIEDLHIKNNAITNCTVATVPALLPHGIIIAPQSSPKRVRHAYITGNTLIGINSSDTGIFFAGDIYEIDYRGNYVRGYTYDYIESGLNNPVYYGEPGVILLAEINVALNAVATTTLYTVPAFRTCSLDHATIIVGADAGASVVSIGGEAATYADFIPNSTLTNLNAANAAGILVPIPATTPLKQQLYPGGRILKMNVTTALGGATNTVRLYGYLY